MLYNKRTAIALITLYCCIVCLYFFEPLLTNQLVSMGVEIRHIGYFFCFGTLSYCIFGPLVGIISKHILEKRYLSFAALFSVAASLFFLGPS